MQSFPAFVIVNTALSTSAKGHYVLLYFTCINKLIFFDSYGRDIGSVNNGHLLVKYINGCSVVHNMYTLQSENSAVCGLYCLYACFCLSRTNSLTEIVLKFTDDVDYNDSLIVYLVDSVYKR